MRTTTNIDSLLTLPLVGATAQRLIPNLEDQFSEDLRFLAEMDEISPFLAAHFMDIEADVQAEYQERLQVIWAEGYENRRAIDGQHKASMLAMDGIKAGAEADKREWERNLAQTQAEFFAGEGYTTLRDLVGSGN